MKTTTISRRRLQCLAFSLRYGNREGARRLGISTQTMKNNLVALYRQVGVTSREQAADELGWLFIPDELWDQTAWEGTPRDE